MAIFGGRGALNLTKGRSYIIVILDSYSTCVVALQQSDGIGPGHG